MAKNDRNLKKFIGIVLLVGGFVFVAFGIGFGLESALFAARSASATGTIVDQIEKLDKDGDRTYTAVFSFMAADGHEYTARNNIATLPPIGAVGDRVKVRYLPDQPENARVESSFVPVFSLVFGGIGAGIVVLGFLVLRSYRRAKRA